MMMSLPGVLPRSFGFVCRSCQVRQIRTSSRLISTKVLTRPATLTINEAPYYITPKCSRRRNASTLSDVLPSSTQTKAPRLPVTSNTRTKPRKPKSVGVENPATTLSNIGRDVASMISAKQVPEEVDVLELCKRISDFSNVLIFGKPDQPSDAEVEEASRAGASSVLDDLDESTRTKTAASTTPLTDVKGLSAAFRTKAADTLCQLTYELIRDPKIHISQPILEIYTRVQCLLGQPQYIPEIFNLFAYKPKARKNTDPIAFKTAWPSSPANAIPAHLSDAALECAIQKKDMPLAIAIIDTSVGTRAYRFTRLIRDASLPAIAVGACPVIAYQFADWLSTYQNVWDVSTSKWTTMAACMAYIGTLTTIGFVAVATWNDQMVRVTWMPGTPLWYRWLREEERAYFDRIAIAWGFKEKWRRGEEQGDEWEALREELGVRSLILDKSNLMDGME